MDNHRISPTPKPTPHQQQLPPPLEHITAQFSSSIGVDIEGEHPLCRPLHQQRQVGPVEVAGKDYQAAKATGDVHDHLPGEADVSREEQLNEAHGDGGHRHQTRPKKRQAVDAADVSEKLEGKD
ncbi:hypothetical protein TYRP_003669 [Tyrophagus putrescentiae]|nr:hypothetical protein TYRP_003669 [Tyrophagus putrescentiae]